VGADNRVEEMVYHPRRKQEASPEVASEFFRAIVAQARTLGLLSNEHFTVDGTLTGAWAALKSFRRKDQTPGGGSDDPGNPMVTSTARSFQCNASVEYRSQALLARKGKGKEAKLCYSANVLVENRNSLPIDF
jgi:hypothetical protein